MNIGPAVLDDRDRDELQELLGRSHLGGITTDELSARRYETATDSDAGATANLQVTVQTRVQGTEFGVRLIAKLNTVIGEVTGKISANYEITDGDAPDARLISIFANEIGVMAVIPYMREAIAAATGRVFGEALHLPMFQRGEIFSEVPKRE